MSKKSTGQRARVHAEWQARFGTRELRMKPETPLEKELCSPNKNAAVKTLTELVRRIVMANGDPSTAPVKVAVWPYCAIGRMIQGRLHLRVERAHRLRFSALEDPLEVDYLFKRGWQVGFVRAFRSEMPELIGEHG